MVKKIDVFLEENSIKQFIVLQPAKDGNGPVWPTSYMEDLIYLILKRLPFNIILLETENSELFIQSIIQKISRKLSGTDANRLFRFRTFRTEERAALLQKATLFIGNYNSCHHIAVAMGVSSIVLYPLSPGMSPQRYSSYGPGDFVALTPHLEPCTKCIQKKCEYKNCLSYIFPEIVFEEMKKLIDTPIKKES